MGLNGYMYIYIYVYIYIHMYIDICIYIYISMGLRPAVDSKTISIYIDRLY